MTSNILMYCIYNGITHVITVRHIMLEYFELMNKEKEKNLYFYCLLIPTTIKDVSHVTDPNECRTLRT